jgi:glycosyltransferase involved in cell wall biosynthesis
MSRPVKVLVVGQTPPPYHGQALMIERLLKGHFARIQLYHVRMAFSGSIDEVGKFRLGKVFHLLGVIARIIYHRIIHGVNVLYYPPAGANRVPMYRDLVILNCTRWMFRHTILHFHAGGAADLYSSLSRPMQWLYRRALFHADAAIRLSQSSPDDGRALAAKRNHIVANGIEDEFPRFEHISSKRAHPWIENAKERAESIVNRGQPLSVENAASSTATIELPPLRILFMGILRESKGLLALLQACAELHRRGVPFGLHIAGQFQTEEFASIARGKVEELDLQHKVHFHGVLQGNAKWQAFAEADVFCFPSFYESESFPTVLLEAMSFQLPVVATRWRGIVEIVDDESTGYLVECRQVAEITDRLEQLQTDPELRDRLGIAGRKKFLGEYALERHLQRMEDILIEAAG